MAKFDFSDLDEPKKNIFSDLDQPTSQEEPEMVDTFLGKMPRHIKEFEQGTPENKAFIEGMINAAAGGPGLKVVGGLISKGVGKGASSLKNIIKNARTNVQPFEQAAEKAGLEYEAANQAATPVKPGIYRTPTSELEDIENQIGHHINIEGEHGTRAASTLKHRVKSIEDFWSNAYKSFEEKIKDAQFHMPQEAMTNLNYDMNEIVRRIQSGANPRTVFQEIQKESVKEANPFYKNLLSKAPTAKDTNASDFLARYRDFRDTLGGLKQDLKSERYGSIEKEKISEAIKKGKEMESQIKETLNEGLGEFKPEFDWINKGYSEQVFPLRKNPLVKAARQGKMPDNIIKSLRTNESGMPFLRDIVKQDPELLRNVIGQRYMSKASEIHNPNELTREYLEEMPEFKRLLGRREEVLKKTAARKDIALKDKIRIENELKDIKAAKAKAIKKLFIGGGAAVGALGVPYGLRKVGSLLGNE